MINTLEWEAFENFKTDYMELWAEYKQVENQDLILEKITFLVLGG